MFGELGLSASILKDALAINIAFTFGCEMSQLAKFYWEFLLIYNKVTDNCYVNIPILLPTKKSKSKEIELRDEDFTYEYIPVK
jgi:hypothetical protein